jgi:hypothetical protein
LKGIRPPIWRRIHVKDCSLDKLHEHIQTAMGWTNSHLHQFMIDGVLHGDPDLLCEGWEDEVQPVDSLHTRLSTTIPGNGKPLRFEYEYDFGDGWQHEIVFEGCLSGGYRVLWPHDPVVDPHVDYPAGEDATRRRVLVAPTFPHSLCQTLLASNGIKKSLPQ